MRFPKFRKKWHSELTLRKWVNIETKGTIFDSNNGTILFTLYQLPGEIHLRRAHGGSASLTPGDRRYTLGVHHISWQEWEIDASV